MHVFYFRLTQLTLHLTGVKPEYPSPVENILELVMDDISDSNEISVAIHGHRATGIGTEI